MTSGGPEFLGCDSLIGWIEPEAELEVDRLRNVSPLVTQPCDPTSVAIGIDTARSVDTVCREHAWHPAEHEGRDLFDDRTDEAAGPHHAGDHQRSGLRFSVRAEEPRLPAALRVLTPILLVP